MRKPIPGTYLLIDRITGQVMRVGQTRDLKKRESAHRCDPVLGPYRFDIDLVIPSYPARRGREQILHELHRPPLDKQEPISPRNKNRKKYLAAAAKLGQG